MNAISVGEHVSLVFTTVLDQMNLGLVDEDEEVEEVTDRAYWEERGSKGTVALADELLDTIHKFDSALNLKYNKFYIGLAKDDHPNNFVVFRPKKNACRVEIRLPQSTELEKRLDDAGLDMMDYDKRWGRYRIRLSKSELKKHEALLEEILKNAYEQTTA